MQNVHSTDGLAEDLIRSFVQIAVMEMHSKTLLEKRVSEMENGLIDVEKPEVLKEQLSKIGDLKEGIAELAQLRRGDMLYLFNLYGAKGDKEKWCSVKHLGIAMMCAFEVWQASDKDEELLTMALGKNRLFIKVLSQFLGVDVTECASCFADILKGEKSMETSEL